MSLIDIESLEDLAPSVRRVANDAYPETYMAPSDWARVYIIENTDHYEDSFLRMSQVDESTYRFRVYAEAATFQSYVVDADDYDTVLAPFIESPLFAVENAPQDRKSV